MELAWFKNLKGVFVFIIKIVLSLSFVMRPDYPHKTFSDRRIHYVLLLHTLSAEARCATL
jgi:hypothetical protein